MLMHKKLHSFVSSPANDFGLNLNSHFVSYERTSIFFEQIDQPSNINEIYFRNVLETYGSGFSFNLGGIAQITDVFRLGVAYKSPTWYNLSDKTTQYLDTYSKDFGYAVADPRIVNKYPDYSLRTPGRWTASLAAIIGKSAVINVGYSIKDYSNMEYDSKGNASFAIPNKRIEQTLQAASTYRIGGEYRLGRWSLRAGYRYKESPYKNEIRMSELIGYSAGIGYNFGNMRIDFAYDHAERDFVDPIRKSGLGYAVRESVFTNYILTLSFAF